MATIINADNGVVSGVPGLKYVSDSTGNLQLQTNGTNALLLDTSQYPSATVNGLGTGRIPAEQFYRLATAYVGSNVATAQSVLGVGVTLVGSTVYQFEGVFMAYKSAGTTAHTVGFGFGGTATTSDINYQIFGNNNVGAGSGVQTQSGVANGWVVTVGNVVAIPSTSSAAVNWFVFIKGTIVVTAGGTFTPQYTLSAAPGGAYTTAIGSYFKISPLGASGSNTSIGTWS
jgi:hypothetical protein